MRHRESGLLATGTLFFAFAMTLWGIGMASWAWASFALSVVALLVLVLGRRGKVGVRLARAIRAVGDVTSIVAFGASVGFVFDALGPGTAEAWAVVVVGFVWIIAWVWVVVTSPVRRSGGS